MTRTSEKMVRVSRSNPCPICGKCDWCLVAPDGSAVICPRTPSARQAGQAGHLHRLKTEFAPAKGPAGHALGRPLVSVRDFGEFAERCRREGWHALQKLAVDLGVPLAALEQLRVGWDGWGRWWSFPMRDASGRVIGIRCRAPAGRKFAVKGSHNGCFFAPSLLAGHPERLVVVEGATDAAAMLGLGFSVVGRPFCRGGDDIVTGIVRAGRPPEVVILPDPDDCGRAGARRLASNLALYCPTVRVTEVPPGRKDVRAAVRAGWSAADIEAAIGRTPPVTARFGSSRVRPRAYP